MGTLVFWLYNGTVLCFVVVVVVVVVVVFQAQ